MSINVVKHVIIAVSLFSDYDIAVSCDGFRVYNMQSNDPTRHVSNHFWGQLALLLYVSWDANFCASLFSCFLGIR
jgi:hypothetical protein